jgi:hypothetical protein
VMPTEAPDPPACPLTDPVVLDPPLPVAGPRSLDTLPVPNRRDREVARSEILEAQVSGMMRTLAAGQVYWIPNFGLHVTRSGPNELTVIEGVKRETVTSRLVIFREVCRRLGVVFRIMDHAIFPPESPEDMVWANAWKPSPPLDKEATRYEPRTADTDALAAPSLAPLYREAEARLPPRAPRATGMEVV